MFCSVRLDLDVPKHPHGGCQIGGCQMLPGDTSLPPQIASLPTPWPDDEAGLSVVSCPVCCDYRGHFSGTLCNHKATFQLSTILPVRLSVPQGWRSSPGSPLLSLSLSHTVSSSPYSPQLKRRHLSDRAIVSRPAHCLLLSLTVMCFD